MLGAALQTAILALRALAEDARFTRDHGLRADLDALRAELETLLVTEEKSARWRAWRSERAAWLLGLPEARAVVELLDDLLDG